MESRFETAKSKGCLGIDPDNMNGFEEDTGFSLTASQQLTYNRVISRAIRDLDFTIGQTDKQPENIKYIASAT